MPTQPINYVDYDFDRLVTQLTDRLKASNTWKDTYRSSTGQMLIELYAYIGNLVLYYVERRAEESYLDTAQLKSSVVNLVRLINYNPARKISAIGTLKFTMATAKLVKVIIPQYTECRTSAGVRYLTSNGAILLPGQLTATVSAIQGQFITNTLSSTGIINQSYNIPDDSVENSNLLVYVNGELWTVVSSFTSATANSKVYKVRTELDGTVTILFGDNIFGKSPSIGDTITYSYIRSAGVSGNVYDTDKITSISGTIYDELSVVVSDLSVTNEEVFVGGDDAETIEDIRYNAPRVFKTGDRAVTKDDFIAILENYGGIANVNVWGENEVSPPNYTLFNTLKLCILMQNWADPSTAFKTALSSYLYTKSLMTVKYEYAQAIILYVIPTMTVRIYRGYAKSQSETNISAALAAQFVLGSTARLGESKRVSTLIAAVEALEEVAYVHMHLELRKDLAEFYDSYYQYGGMAEALTIIKDSLVVLVGASDATATQIAHTDSTGALISDDAMYVGGTFNYTTGYIGIDANIPSGQFIWVRYQQDNESAGFSGDIIVDMDQICRLYNDQADITEIKYTDE